MEKYKKSHTKTINLKYQLRRGIKNLSYLTDNILYQIFKIILNISLEKHREKIHYLSIRVYVNKIENRITFKIKTGYYLELKIKNDENIPNLGITEVVLVHQDSRVLYTFIPNKSFG